MGQLSAIAQFADPEEAYCAKGFLGARGIDCLIQNDHHLTMAPFLREALGGYRLMAPDIFASEAKAALQEVAKTHRGIAVDAAPKSDFLAPERKPKNWLWLPIAFLFATPFLPTRKRGLIGIFQFLALIGLYAGLVSMTGIFAGY